LKYFLLALLAVLSISSCTKTYNCDCVKFVSVNVNDSIIEYSEVVYVEIEDKEKAAKEECEAKNRDENDGNGNIDRLTCSISLAE
jgi:hypothetical protein